MMRLAVELHGALIGTLTGDPRTFDFTPSGAAIERFGLNSTALSVAIPLSERPRRDHAERRRNWFRELLPEGDQYEYMLQQGGLRRGDTLGFLARYGRDVAGALQLWDLDDEQEPRTPETRELTASQIRALLEDPVTSPLANAPGTGKSSLGGVQPKIVLARTATGWAQALGGFPSSHILKPQLHGESASVIFDEEYGARLSRRLGLAAFDASIETFDGLQALVIERFDRHGDARVHQEDFNQALGASGNEKYQELGGAVSLARIADTVTRHAPEEDLKRLARMTTFAVAIGNLDMHAKNLGLLHPAIGPVRLAPAYDVVPQAHMPNDGRLALAVNREYRHSEITRKDLAAEFSTWGLPRAAAVTAACLDELQVLVQEETPLSGSFPELQQQVLECTESLLAG